MSDRIDIFLLGKNGQLGRELEIEAGLGNLKVASYGREDLDITDTVAVNAEIDRVNPRLVINATAYHVLPDCEKYPEKAFLINAIALRDLAIHCRERDIPFVSYSTDYVFDGDKAQPYEEDDRPNPLQVYGISKLAGEMFCRNYHPGSIIIRTCGVYGGGLVGSRSKGGNFVLSIIRSAEHKRELEVSSEQIVIPTSASDLARGSLELLAKNPPGGIYHLVNAGQCSWAEFAIEISRMANLQIRIIPVDRRGTYGGLRRPMFSVLANTKAKKLGIVLPAWKEALERYLNALK